MKYAIGLMSGTSFDGLDIALVQIEGVSESTNITLKAFKTYAYDSAYRNKLIAACQGELDIRAYCSLNFEIAQQYAHFIKRFLGEFKYNLHDISFIGSHGQTIYHLVDPKEHEFKSSLQLGDGSVLANLTGIVTVSDFRVADLANGGQGAPIVCYPEYVLYRDLHAHVILQNIGGISNCTVLNQDMNNVFAFDNGPGNVIIDYVCQHYFNQPFDDGGVLGQQGKVCDEVIAFLANDEYYTRLPPKTTGREKYNNEFITHLINQFKHLDKHDLLRSVTYFSAKTIIESYQQFVMKDDTTQYLAIVSGGGASNSLLMQDLQALAPKNILIKSGWDYNINTDAKEAVAMVILANQTLHQLPSNIPSATGATKPTILGKISYPWKGNK